MSHTAPACRANILVLLLECPSSSVPAGIQVLALRALGRLMHLSDELADKYGAVIARLLAAASKPPPAQHAPSAGCDGPDLAAGGLSDTDPKQAQQQATWEATELVAAAALQVTEALVSGSPNVNASLLSHVQSLVLRLHQHHQQESKEAHEEDEEQASADQDWPGHQLFVLATSTCARILSSERLHVQPPGWALFAQLAASTGAPQQVRAITLQLLRSLLGAPGSTQGPPTPALRMRRVRGAMALFGNCPAALRLALVDEVGGLKQCCCLGWACPADYGFLCVLFIGGSVFPASLFALKLLLLLLHPHSSQAPTALAELNKCAQAPADLRNPTARRAPAVHISRCVTFRCY